MRLRLRLQSSNQHFLDAPVAVLPHRNIVISGSRHCRKDRQRPLQCRHERPTARLPRGTRIEPPIFPGIWLEEHISSPAQPRLAFHLQHWGTVPASQTKDLRELPGDYGVGSSTLLFWITVRYPLLSQSLAAATVSATVYDE